MTLVLFTAGWFLTVYLFHCVIARTWKRVDAQTALLYMTTVSLVGVFGEVFGDSLYNFLFGKPLWLYHFTPIHGGYTSLYSMVVWGLYGFWLYLMHDTLAIYEHRTRVLAAIIGFEAIALEFVLNGTFFLILGGYFFYYLPGDLWHFTSLQAIPLYFLAGVVMVKTIRRFKADPRFFIAMNVMLVFVFAFLTSR